MEENKLIDSKLEGIVAGSIAAAPIGFAIGYLGSFFTPSSIIRMFPLLTKKVKEDYFNQESLGDKAWEKTFNYSALYSAIIGQSAITLMMTREQADPIMLPIWLITNGVSALYELVIAANKTIADMD